MPLRTPPTQQNINTGGRVSRAWHLWFDSMFRLLGNVRDDKSIQPIRLEDANAQKDSIYYSITQSKLVYKDDLGVVNVLY